MGDKTVAQVLEDAAALIEPDGKWTQGEYALDASGFKTSPVSKARQPVCFCMLGAVKHASGNPREDSKVMNWLHYNLGSRGTWLFNDAEGRTQAEVVAKLRDAAAVARGEA